MSVQPRIACRRCRHFYITWDPRFPYGCRAMGFKSRVLPSQAVRASSGMRCLAFSRKPDARRRSAG